MKLRLLGLARDKLARGPVPDKLPESPLAAVLTAEYHASRKQQGGPAEQVTKPAPLEAKAAAAAKVKGLVTRS
jgi:hypothetical protein